MIVNNSLIKQKPEGRRRKEEGRRKEEETQQEEWWTSQLRSPLKVLPPRDCPYVLEAPSCDRSRPGAPPGPQTASTDPHGEPSGYVCAPLLPGLHWPGQATRVPGPPRKIEVLHLFRCSTHTRTSSRRNGSDIVPMKDEDENEGEDQPTQERTRREGASQSKQKEGATKQQQRKGEQRRKGRRKSQQRQAATTGNNDVRGTTRCVQCTCVTMTLAYSYRCATCVFVDSSSRSRHSRLQRSCETSTASAPQKRNQKKTTWQTCVSLSVWECGNLSPSASVKW